MSRHHLDRRTFLRGVAGGTGVSLGLPLLEAMLDDNGTALASGTALPKRFVVWFWGNGTAPGEWAPLTTGAGWTPSSILQPLSNVRDYVNVVSGTVLPTKWHLGAPDRHNPHAEGTAAIMAGGNPAIHPSYSGQANDWDYMSAPGPSLDQVAARYIAGTSSFRSIEAAVTYAGETSLPGTITFYTSYNDAYNFNRPFEDPVDVFNRLFGNGVPTQTSSPTTTPAPDPMFLARARLLDAVLGDAASLRSKLGANDRRRLDAHIDAVNVLEQRVRTLAAASTTGPQPTGSCAMPAQPSNPSSDRERARIMADLMAMAFACDITRVGSVQLSCPASHVGYPDIFPNGFRFNGGNISFHEYEHNAGIDDTVRAALTYFVQCYADFVAALEALPEGDGNVLDQSCVLGTSELAAGPDHGFSDFPLLIAGRAGGALRYPGVHVAAQGDLTTRVPLTCLRAVGCPLDSWGADQFHVDASLGAIES